MPPRITQLEVRGTAARKADSGRGKESLLGALLFSFNLK